MQRVAAYWYLDPQTALVQVGPWTALVHAASSSELTLASFKTPVLEEAPAETAVAQLLPVHMDYYWVHWKLSVDFVPSEVM